MDFDFVPANDPSTATPADQQQPQNDFQFMSDAIGESGPSGGFEAMNSIPLTSNPMESMNSMPMGQEPSEPLDEEEQKRIEARKQEEDERRKKHVGNTFGIMVDGIDKAQIKIASCCHPILGDPIIGYVSKGNGIIVHRFDCPNARNSEQNRFIDVYWDKDAVVSKQFESLISILSFNRKNILADIINVLNSTTISISNITSTKNKQGELITKIKLMVKDVDTLENALVNLRKISDVYSVERVMK